MRNQACRRATDPEARRRVPSRRPPRCSGVSFEVGTRISYSSGSLAKDLFSDPRAPNTVLNSRLTYSGLTAGTFEGFGRAELPYGSFIKGYAGFGGLSTGALSDEDFPPGRCPIPTRGAISTAAGWPTAWSISVRHWPAPRAPLAQQLNFTTRRYGGFAQASYRLGPM
jgi:hypothetical protein